MHVAHVFNCDLSVLWSSLSHIICYLLMVGYRDVIIGVNGCIS